MRDYELTVVLAGDATPAKAKQAKENVEKIINTYKGKVEKSDDWGKLELAYPIKGNETGKFYFYNLQLEADTAKVLSDKLRLEEGIIRYLLVRKDN